MGATRAKVFMHGGSQAVRLPKEFRFDSAEVAIHREGRRVILEPATGQDDDIDALFARIDALRGEHYLEAPEDPPAEDPW